MRSFTRVAAGLLAGVLAWPGVGAASVEDGELEPNLTALRADLVVIEKAARRLSLFTHGRLLGSYRVALGASPVGTKECQGDNRTPEGFYRVSGRNAGSRFHRSLKLSYPSDHDLARARALGCDPGGDIMIHGLQTDVGRAHLVTDWTRGCVAVTNEEIEEIWALVPDGARVEIRP